jgi:hypothetical protein
VSDWRRLKLGDDDLRALEATLLADPDAGDVIPDTGGLRKVRFAPPAWRRGKRGAMRVVYAHLPTAELVYFFLAYGKNEQGDMTRAEKNQARATMQRVRQAVRTGGP